MENAIWFPKANITLPDLTRPNKEGVLWVKKEQSGA